MYRILTAVTIATFVLCGCTKEFPNPNAPSLDDALATQEGITSLMVGIKNRFAVNSSSGNAAVYLAVTTNGFTTSEINLKPAGGNLDLNQLAANGTAITSNNTIITDLWSNCLLVNQHTSLILEHLDNMRDPILRTNVQRYALLFKAMSIGTLVNFWQQVPIETGKNAVFVDSTEALKKAVSLLREALNLPDPPVDAKLGPEINLRNSLHALSARYQLMIGNYDSAISHAAAVDLIPANAASKSIFIFNNQNANPVFRSGYNSQFGYLPSDSMGLSKVLFPLKNDSNRARFYTVDQNPTTEFSYGFWKNDADPVPLYLPGEMLLIQAEAYARKGDLVNGKIFLDRVLTKKANQDPFGLGAGMDPYAGAMTQDALLLEIYRNRCVELFMSGLKLSDSRRFRRPGPKDPKPERKRNYFPYPQQEALGNPNTPVNPDI